MSSKRTTLWSSICLAMLLTYVAGFIGSCSDKSEIAQVSERDNEDGALSDNQFFKQNVAFADARVRSISETECVKEIVLIDFSRSSRMPSSLIFEGTTFFDDGSYNDLQANDGIYASAAVFSHSERLPFDKQLTVRSVMKQIVIDSDFQFDDRIKYIAAVYSMPANSKRVAESEADLSWIKIVAKCKLEFGICFCRADDWGLCDCCCFWVGDCSGEFEVHIEW